jgi:type II secretory pathway pseudopilin PulG
MFLSTALEIVTQRGSFLSQVVFILIIGALIRYQRRKRANVANMAYIQNAQQQAQAATHAQWNAQQQAYVPPYGGPGGYDPTNAGVGTPGAYDPTNAGAYESHKGPLYQSPETTGTFPKPATPQTTGDVPQYPPPTYTGGS